MKGYIYSITNQINNKKYIGQTLNIERRQSDHFRDLEKGTHHSIKLQRAYNKHGKQNFKFNFKIVEISSQEELYLLEMKEIEKEDSFFNGYNMTLGGEGHKNKLDFKNSVLYYQILSKYEGIERLIERKTNISRDVLSSIKMNSYIYENEKYDEQQLIKLIMKLGLEEKNLKENYIPHNAKKLNKEQCFAILSIITKEQGYDKTLCEIFNISSKLTYRLRRSLIYVDYIKEFNSLPEAEKEKIRQETFDKYKVKDIYAKRNRRCVANPLSQNEVDYILDNIGQKTQAEIARNLKISVDRVRGIKNGTTYKDLIENYKKRQEIKLP